MLVYTRAELTTALSYRLIHFMISQSRAVWVKGHRIWPYGANGIGIFTGCTVRTTQHIPGLTAVEQSPKLEPKQQNPSAQGCRCGCAGRNSVSVTSGGRADVFFD